MSKIADRNIRVGRIAGVYGVKGWVKVFSYTEPRENVVSYRAWTLKGGALDADSSTREVEVEAGRRQGKQVLAKLEGFDDRDQAASLVGAEIEVSRRELPDCEPGHYYWADLEGLTVKSTDGEVLGTVERLMETGAHDVLLLAGHGERMIPFVLGQIVRDVSIEDGVITVDWKPEFWEG